ncbi:periplasmic phosphate-binding protein of phosphate ABC transporter [Calothrix sp. NIES-4071]|nr:periplasmic phosphate-binding protein of phosphate ABC transporter [Calothrix sp. NIES-4071]BAZ58053.1 periplasmic phosphate-binding protein of phosphate ABC transporter [Calothrix sp. NIES-4105]
MSINQRKPLINGEIGLFLRGLIIGKVLTIMVIGGLFWWLLKPRLVSTSADSSTGQTLNTAQNATSTFGTIASVPPGSFNYGGSTAWAPIRQLVDSQIQNARPELQLRYVNPNDGNPGSSSGIRMLLDGELDFAHSARPLTASEYAEAEQRGFTLSQHQVGIDGIAVVVNPSLNVPGLTIEQLQQIYSGQITNWKQVGGPNLSITPFSQHPEDADIVIASNNVNNRASSSNVQYVNSTTEALRQVSKTPGSIYYASARAVVPQCTVKALPLGRTSSELIPPYQQPLASSQQCLTQRNQVNTEAIKNGSYPITTKLFVIVKQDKGRSQQAGEAYARLLLTDQGQNAIEQAGFVGVRP